MLVLTRKLGESIRIGDNITVKVVDLDSRHVKLGIDAPRTVSVNREEIYERIQNENKAAAVPMDQNVRNIADAFRKSKNR
jgi:carbon storage regulator